MLSVRWVFRPGASMRILCEGPWGLLLKVAASVGSSMRFYMLRRR